MPAYLFPALSSAGASLGSPCSVSTSRSSNRTGGVTASGSRKRLTSFCVTPSATSEHNPGWLDSIVNPHVLRCFLRPSLTEAPSLRRSYPAPSVLPSLPCSPSFVAVFKLGPLCTLRTWHSVINFSCCSACTPTVACDCDLATDSFGSGSPEFGPIGALPCAL